MKAEVMNKNIQFLAGGGEMGELTRGKDWSTTPVGKPETWPQSLRTTISIILNSRFPMFLFWGPELICFYNDAYRPSLGQEGKHPTILGAPAEESWTEIWSIIKPLIDQVLAGKGGTWSEDQLIPIYRNGKIEDVYWTFGYSPVNDESGKPSGVLVTCMETTAKVKTYINLEESNRRYYNNIMQAPVAMCILRGENYIVDIANELILEIWGKTAGEVMNKPLFEGLPEVRGQGIEILLENVYQTGEKFVANERPVNLPRNGKIETTYINFIYEALREPDETISGIVAIATEVTSQVLARKKVEESEKEFRQLADSLPQLVWTTDNKGAQIFASKRWKEFTGIDPYGEETFMAMVHPEDIKKMVDVWLDCIITGKTYITQARLKSKKGGYEWFYVNGEAIKNEAGEIEKWVGAFTNIDEQKRAQEELTIAFHKIEESEKRFKNVADSAPVLIWMGGTDRLCNFLNKEWLHFTGRSMEQEKGNGWTEGIYPEDFQRCLDTYNAAFDKQEEFYMEFRLRRHDGEYRWISDKGVPRFTAEGVFEGYIGACLDIHEQIIYQKQLKDDEERLNIIINASELGTWELNLKTREVSYSDRYLAVFGYKDRIDLIHEELVNHLHPDDLPIRTEAFKRAYATGFLHYQSRLIWKDGSIHWIEGKGKVFYNEVNEPVKLMGTIREITEEKHYQQQLEEREQKFRLLADSMPQHIWTADTEGNLNYFNQSVFDYSGLTPEQVDELGWLHIVHPDDREENVRVWIEAVTTGEDFIFEHRFRRHDGEYRWQLSRAIPQRDAAGNIRMWVGTSTDIQDQKMFTDELEKQVQERTRELEQKNKELVNMNTELESFAYVSSHDLQEPLRKIQTFSSLIIDKELENLSDIGREYFRRMQEAAKRMQTLIEDLLTYSRTNSTDRIFKKANLNELINEVKNDIREVLAEKHALVEVDSMCEVNIIPFQFRQLIHNLISNSLKFSKPDVPPVIKMQSKIVAGGELNIPQLSPNIIYCHMTISDNGIGFDPQYKERIFEVFQRLHGKADYKGTGIGLAIVKKIVENHNGYINAIGELDKGATFNLYLPV